MNQETLSMQTYSGWQLKVVRGTLFKRLIQLEERDYRLGRSTAGQKQGPGEIFIKDRTVSRIHAELRWDSKAKRFSLCHLSTTNQTLLNADPLRANSSVPLNEGDMIEIGVVAIVFGATDVDPATVAGAKQLNLDSSQLANEGALQVAPRKSEPVKFEKEDSKKAVNDVIDILKGMRDLAKPDP